MSVSEDRATCVSCRRDAPIAFFIHRGQPPSDCCASCRGYQPELTGWCDAKLAKYKTRVKCECGAMVAKSYIYKHRKTKVHKRVLGLLMDKDPAFAAEVEEKEAARRRALEERHAAADARKKERESYDTT